MDTASAIERLANYSKKNTRASREIFEAGVVIFDGDALLRRLGDDSARLSLSSQWWSSPERCPPTQPLSIVRPADHSIFPGWQFLESLALASIDVGRIDVAQVSRPNTQYPCICI